MNNKIELSEISDRPHYLQLAYRFLGYGMNKRLSVQVKITGNVVQSEYVVVCEYVYGDLQYTCFEHHCTDVEQAIDMFNEIEYHNAVMHALDSWGVNIPALVDDIENGKKKLDAAVLVRRCIAIASDVGPEEIRIIPRKGSLDDYASITPKLYKVPYLAPETIVEYRLDALCMGLWRAVIENRDEDCMTAVAELVELIIDIHTSDLLRRDLRIYDILNFQRAGRKHVMVRKNSCTAYGLNYKDVYVKGYSLEK
jgi:hypothetical protein